MTDDNNKSGIDTETLSNLYRNNQNAAILKLIKISENCHGRFTANYPKVFFSRTLMEVKCNRILLF